MDGNIIFATRLRSQREDAGLSLRELSEKTGISYQALHHYEKGDRDPSIWNVKKISDFFNVSIDWLIGTTDNKR